MQKHRRPDLRLYAHWLPALGWMAAIFVLSSMPADRVGAVLEPLDRSYPAPGLTVSGPEPRRLTLEWGKVGHVIGYVGLGSAYLYALQRHWRMRNGAGGSGSKRRAWWAGGLAVLLSMLYAITDEFHQACVPGRSAAAADVALDTVAALGGVLLWRLGAWGAGLLGLSGGRILRR